MPFAATWMDVENIVLSEIHIPHISDIVLVRQRQVLYDITYVWNLENNTNESVYKTETDIQT